MATRIAILGDIHGNIAALDAAVKDIKKAKAELILVTGDLVMNGPKPADVIDRLRDLEASAGTVVIQGNTDIAVADFDFAAAFPWLDEVSDAQRVVAEWTHDALSDEHLDWIRRLPSERRVMLGDHLMLVCHGSPGSQTSGLTVDLDPSVTVERVTRTDARVIGCGHTHVADVRELGRKLIVNPGSCGYAFDGDAGAAWALLTIGEDGDGEPGAELMRTTYDATAVADEVSARGLPGDVYRAATIRTGRFVR
ncbi:MAG: metallophosphoesterase family protein [Candidatus Limnocylindrales bacterium]